MKTANKISLVAGVLAGLYGSSILAATSGLIFSSQPAAHTMGTNSSQQLVYTLYNQSNQPVNIKNVDVGPHDNPRYWSTSNDCASTVAPGQSCHIKLILQSPADPGFMNTVLVITYGQSSLRSNPIQFDVVAVPASNYKAAASPTTKTMKTSTHSTTTTNKTVAQTSAPQATPGIVFTSSESKAMVPLNDPQAAYNTSGAQINIYAGWSNINTSHSNIVFDQYETDTLVGSDSSSTFIPGVGVSYDFVLNPNGGFIHGVGLGVDFFNDNYKRTGQVYQYQLPQYDNYTYKAQVNSSRLLLNGELDFHPLWHGLTFFAEGGVGGAYNQLRFNETAGPNANAGALNMPNNLTLNFAYDVGGGVKLPVSSNLELSFRYLYTDPGVAETGTVSNDNVTLQQPIKFDMKSNSWLFGLSYLIR